MIYPPCERVEIESKSDPQDHPLTAPSMIPFSKYFDMKG
jgi:hypothetical protein